MTDAIAPTDAQRPLAQSGGEFAATVARNKGAALLFDPDNFGQMQRIAMSIADSGGFVGRHLQGKVGACMAVVHKSMVWNLDPYAVAGAVYETPGGRVGYEGALVHAILEASGKFRGPITFEHFGEWERIRGRFEVIEREKPDGRGGQKKSRFPVQRWKPEDEQGLGVTVKGHLIGEAEPRSIKVFLSQATTRNATTWPTDPEWQICNFAVRRFARRVVPSLLFGAHFDEEVTADTAPEMRDVTPPGEAAATVAGSALDHFATDEKTASGDATTPEAAEEPAPAAPPRKITLTINGQEIEYPSPSAAAGTLQNLIDEAPTASAVWKIIDDNEPYLASIKPEAAQKLRTRAENQVDLLNAADSDGQRRFDEASTR